VVANQRVSSALLLAVTKAASRHLIQIIKMQARTILKQNELIHHQLGLGQARQQGNCQQRISP